MRTCRKRWALCVAEVGVKNRRSVESARFFILVAFFFSFMFYGFVLGP